MRVSYGFQEYDRIPEVKKRTFSSMVRAYLGQKFPYQPGSKGDKHKRDKLEPDRGEPWVGSSYDDYCAGEQRPHGAVRGRDLIQWLYGKSKLWGN